MMSRILRFLLFPLTLFKSFFVEYLGDGEWYRKQVQLMESRPPLPNAEYLAAVNCSEADEPFWIAFRDAFAACVGVPSEAIRPEDSLRTLWRMQWLGPDVLAIIFQMEKRLELKIPASRFLLAKDLRQIEAFAEFGWLMVGAFHKSRAT
jgi:hypothetical protein